MDDFSINCILKGQKGTTVQQRVLPIEVPPSKTVGYLRELIKERKKVYFNNVDTDALNLWGVSIPLDDNADVALKELVFEENGEKGIRRLLPAKRLSSYFSDQPKEDHIHVVIEPPSGEWQKSLRSFVV
jgi:hypothetical protein